MRKYVFFSDLPSGSRKFNCPLIDHYNVIKSDQMPYGYTRMKWRKRKILLDDYFTSNCWEPDNKNFAHEESHENYTFLLQSHLWQLLWQKILNTDKPTNGSPNDWNFALNDKRSEGFIFFLYLKNHVFNHTLLTDVLYTPACWQATKSPSVSPIYLF